MESAAATHFTAQTALNLLKDLPSDIKILSLDCFDTLLWRTTLTPSDAFYQLVTAEPFKTIKMSALQRIKAEMEARKKQFRVKGNTEVTLADIYRAYDEHLDPDTICALSAAELAMEMAVCYPFSPMMQLIRAAHARGLKIIIVSDTYFSENELRQLLKTTLPHDVYNLIDLVFCSSQHGASKYQGLFNVVLKQLNVPARQLLHLGDNPMADLQAAQKAGLNASQLIHFDEYTKRLLRLQATTGMILEPGIRHDRPLTNPYRGLLANKHDLDDAANYLGYLTLGPLMHAFGQFIIKTIDQLNQAGKKTKIAFLLRDAFLPFQVTEALAGHPVGQLVRISRFSAYAASFSNEEDVMHYVMDNVGSERFDDIGKQLLLSDKMRTSLTNEAKAAAKPANAYLQAVSRGYVMKAILNAAEQYRQRFLKHLQMDLALESGDTLVFVDLGYTGTAQNKLTPIFRKALNIDIYGCYLIALHTPKWQTNRTGLLNPDCVDDRTLSTLVAYIALLEQLCTTTQQSVIDYTAQGEPIYADTKLSDEQHTKLIAVQENCVQFVKEAQDYLAHSRIQINATEFRDIALSSLARLLFLPTREELDYLRDFQFELNLGTSDLLDVFDSEKGLMGLRRRGLFFMEKNLSSMRTNYPAELRSAGMELVLTLLLQHRTGFDLRAEDLSLRREKVDILVLSNGQTLPQTLEAMPTYDGYYALLTPIGLGQFHIGLNFGARFNWIQIESAEIMPTQTLLSSNESTHSINVESCLSGQAIADHGGGLFECIDSTSLILFTPPEMTFNVPYTLRIIFRPIVARQLKANKDTNHAKSETLECY